MPSILFWIVFEAGLWLFSPLPIYDAGLEWAPDAHIGGRGLPGSEFRNVNGTRIKINRFGFRGPDPTWHPPPGTLRILAFGGSSTLNANMTDQETWAGALAGILSTELKMPVEVLNMGLPGFTSQHSKLNYLINGRELHAHAAVLYHCWNDLEIFRGEERDPGYTMFMPPWGQKPLWARVVLSTQTGQRIIRARRRIIDYRSELLTRSLELAGRPENIMPGPAGYQWVETNYRDFIKWTKDDGVLPIIVSQATIAVEANLHTENYEYRSRIDGYGIDMSVPVIAATWLKIRDLQARLSEATDTIYIDGFANVPHDFEHLSDQVHMTPLGARKLAIAIGGKLVTAPTFLELAERVKRSDNVGTLSQKKK